MDIFKRDDGSGGDGLGEVELECHVISNGSEYEGRGLNTLAAEGSRWRGTGALEVELELAVRAAAVQVEEVAVFALVEAEVESITTDLNADSTVKGVSHKARSIFAARTGAHVESPAGRTGLTLAS